MGSAAWTFDFNCASKTALLSTVSHHGLIELNDKVQAGLAGTPSQYEDHYFRVAARMETGDPRHSWVNQTLFVAQGRLLPGAVEYTVDRLT